MEICADVQGIDPFGMPPVHFVLMQRMSFSLVGALAVIVLNGMNAKVTKIQV
jgi:hypothetical protein